MFKIKKTLSPDSFIESLFLLISGYFAFTTLSVLIVAKTFTIYDIYSTFCVSLLFLSTIFSIRRYKNKSCSTENFSPIDLIGLFIVVLAFCILRLREISNIPFWLDEYTQFVFGFHKNHESLTDFAASQQQPPLDYFLSFFANYFYGLSVTSARIHSFLAGLIFILVHFSAVKSLTKNSWVTFGTSLLILYVPIIQFYTVEARPFGLGLCLSLFVLYFYIQFLKTYGNKKYFMLSLLSQCTFVLTTGLQPEVFIMVLCFSLLLGLLFCKQRGIVLKYWFISTLTAIFFFPFFFLIYKKSDELSQFNSSWLVSFTKALSQRSLDDYYIFFNFLKNQSLFLIFPLGAFTIIIKNANKKNLKNLFQNHFIGISFLLIFSIFPICFLLIYDTFINWPVSPRYFLCFFSVPLLSIALATHFIYAEGKKLTKLLVPLLFAIFTIFSIWKASQLKAGEDYLENRNLRHDWKSAYEFLLNNLKEKDLVYHFTLHKYPSWRSSIYVNIEIFIPEEKRHFFRNLFPTLEFMHSYSNLGEDIASGKANGKIFLFSTPYGADFEVTSVLYKPSPYIKNSHYFQGLTIREFKNGEDVISFLNALRDLYPKHPSLSMVYEVLISYYISKKENSKAKKLNNEFSNLELQKNSQTLGDSHHTKSSLQKTTNFFFKWIKTGKKPAI